jgi:hypothetical protein
MSILTYFGLLEERVKYLSYEIGTVDTSVFEAATNDYVMFVNFKSKGAFIAGREIDVSIDFKALQKVEKFKNRDLRVVFPGALPYPIPKDISKIAEAHVELSFVDDDSAHGEKTIIYQMPELAAQPALIPFKTEGKYTYNLLINMRPQTMDKFLRTNAFLYVAPLETKLQVKNNNLILILTYFAIYLAIVQIVISIQKRKTAGEENPPCVSSWFMVRSRIINHER